MGAAQKRESLKPTAREPSTDAWARIELAALHEIATLELAKTVDELAHAASEKAARLFGARRFLLFKGTPEQPQPLISWGFSSTQSFQKVFEEERPNVYRADLDADAGELGAIFIELAKPLSERQRRLLAIFFRRINAGWRLLVNAEQRKQAERALRAERDLFSGGPVCTMVWQPKEGWPVLRVSENVHQILGYTPEELKAESFRYASLIHPEDVERIADEVRACIKDKTDKYEQSYRLKTRHGEYRWFYDFTRLVWDDQNRLQEIHGYLMDQSGIKETEWALERERQCLADIIAGTHVGTWEWGVQSGHLVVNKRWAEMIGYTIEELSPMTMETANQLMDPRDRQNRERLLGRHFSGETDHYECEIRLRHKEGRWIWVLDRGKVSEWTEDGKPLLMQGTYQNITQRKQEEEALRQSEERATRQRAAIAGLALDEAVVSGEMEEALKRITQVLGETVRVARASVWKLSEDGAELQCLSLYEADHDRHSAGAVLKTSEFHRYFEAIMAENRIYAEDVQADPRTHELMEGYLKPLGIASMLDAGILLEGRLQGVVCLEHIGSKRRWHADEEAFVSTAAALVAQLMVNARRKEAERAFRESEEMLSALFGAMTEMVVLYELITDEQNEPVNYRMTNCNSAFTRITGIKREDAVGRLVTEIHEADIPPHLEAYARVVRTGKPCRFELYAPSLGKHFSMSVISMGDPRFATISTDITAAKEVQQLIAAKNKELERIIYVASHDLRSPLVNVDGYGRELGYTVETFKNVLENKEVSKQSLEATLRLALPDMIDALHHIRGSTRQMDALLKGLLKLSRSGRAALHVELLDMNKLVAHVVSSVDYRVRELRATLHVEELPPCRGDEVQVSQVFANLIGNALKFLDANRPGRIDVKGYKEHGDSVYCVQDNGIGIVPEHWEKIFALFHRVFPEHTDGDGLGLPIVRQILGRLQGHIWVESTPGEGSRFYVRLPGEQLE